MFQNRIINQSFIQITQPSTMTQRELTTGDIVLYEGKEYLYGGDGDLCFLYETLDGLEHGNIKHFVELGDVTFVRPCPFLPEKDLETPEGIKKELARLINETSL